MTVRAAAAFTVQYEINTLRRIGRTLMYWPATRESLPRVSYFTAHKHTRARFSTLLWSREVWPHDGFDAHAAGAPHSREPKKTEGDGASSSDMDASRRARVSTGEREAVRQPGCSCQ